MAPKAKIRQGGDKAAADKVVVEAGAAVGKAVAGGKVGVADVKEGDPYPAFLGKDLPINPKAIRQQAKAGEAVSDSDLQPSRFFKPDGL